jgi:hypothetical protein
VIVGTLALEGLTLAIRYGLGISARRFYSGGLGQYPWLKKTGCFLRRVTFGYRIHHGYVGAAMWVVGVTILNPMVANVGAILFWSDVLHHTLLLLFTGDSEFDITYDQSDQRLKRAAESLL